MKPSEILRYFITYAVILPIVFVFGFAFVIFLIVPFVAAFFVDHWVWQPLNNKSIGSVLLSIPVGLWIAGMMTLISWYERTDLAAIEKLSISIVVSTIIFGSMYQVVLWINLFFPH